MAAACWTTHVLAAAWPRKVGAGMLAAGAVHSFRTRQWMAYLRQQCRCKLIILSLGPCHCHSMRATQSLAPGPALAMPLRPMMPAVAAQGSRKKTTTTMRHGSHH